ncbi:MAG: TadE/TadG family type IV pilus assembly protein, partial [Actinomycetota bacterium]
MSERGPRGRDRSRGQALIEFSFGIMIFLALFVGMIDLARAVLMFNGVASAAREIARETSIHPGSGDLGDSAESLAAVTIQKRLVPGFQDPEYQCFDIEGVLQVDACQSADWVRVNATAVFHPALPVLTMLGPLTLTSSS